MSLKRTEIDSGDAKIDKYGGDAKIMADKSTKLTIILIREGL